MSQKTQPLLNLIENFRPDGEQEIVDRELLLKFAHDEINLTRESEAHFTASAFVINQTHDKVLAIYHVIYQSWAWMGGHADSNADLLQVAEQEAREESGLTKLKLLKPAPISIESVAVAPHMRRGKYVPAHAHLNATFLFEADETDELQHELIATDGVRWMPFDELVSEAKLHDPYVVPIYEKIISRIEKEDK
ncbi:NUDIX domain-containing protein [Candidatus Saccharibacteria bacterium]|nr:NUDIX domain-containing protein [Candidatus Saccharibacteria bacterium]